MVWSVAYFTKWSKLLPISQNRPCYGIYDTWYMVQSDLCERQPLYKTYLYIKAIFTCIQRPTLCGNRLSVSHGQSLYTGFTVETQAYSGSFLPLTQYSLATSFSV